VATGGSMLDPVIVEALTRPVQSGHDLSADEEDQAWDAHYAEAHGGLRAFVDVQLEYIEAVGPLRGELFDQRVELAAWMAPNGAEIDEDWFVGLKHTRVEVRVGHLGQIRHAVLLRGGWHPKPGPSNPSRG